MAALKRKHALVNQAESNANYFEEEALSSEDELDLSSILVGKQAKKQPAVPQNADSDDELNEIIQTSIVKRNIKGGTDVVKRAKGKTKIAKGEVGGGSFQSMGLHPSLLRSLTLQGYRIPTPIQRLSIPALLANPPRDLVGMARTGSGKSLAYMIPLVQRLNGRHATTFGARALILLPTRELALQLLKVGKELARGWHAGGGEHAGDGKESDTKKGQNLRWSLIVGGEGLDQQFEMISDNPDIIVATPGRLLHLIVEMNMDLKSVQYVVFDEADRLFEMGFEVALNEILQRLPASRQTLLFSATLPKSLVEFAKAGLQDPKLVRLDAESKISSDLKMAFFSVKQAEKDASLLLLLRDVIKVPFGGNEENPAEVRHNAKGKHREQVTKPHQTLVFAATKHHVEYLTNLLTTAGYAVSHIYGSLDQAARSHQMDQFRRGMTNVLVVTDVAARGIDIPVLENVINYDFPHGARVFVHRVGRTARAGRQGWAWSFVTMTELPYLLDLQLFLGRPLQSEVFEAGDQAYTESLILGTFPRDKIDEDVEHIRSLEDVNHALPTLREVMKRGHAMYERSKGKASPQSYVRAKEMTKDAKWSLAGSHSGIHPVLLRGIDGSPKKATEEARKALLLAVNSFKPEETVFEVGTKGNPANAALMKERKKALEKARNRAVFSSTSKLAADEPPEVYPKNARPAIEMADEEEIIAVFDTSKGKPDFRDSDFYMSHYQKNALTEKGYSLTDGASTFAEQARSATFDLSNDDGAAADRKRRQLTWDKKKKKFIKGDGVGADNVKLVRTENGTRLPATYRSGRFDEWKKQMRVSLPRVGEVENDGGGGRSAAGRFGGVGAGPGGKRYKHNRAVPAKPLDKRSTDYERKARHLKKRVEGEADAGPSPSRPSFSSSSRPPPTSSSRRGKPPSKRYGDKSYGRVKSEIKNVEQIRKGRKMEANKKAKNARPSRGKKGRR